MGHIYFNISDQKHITPSNLFQNLILKNYSMTVFQQISEQKLGRSISLAVARQRSVPDNTRRVSTV